MINILKKNIVIHCIGDSHVSVFSGQKEMQPVWPKKSNNIIPFFKSYRLGPVLAYNLCKSDTRSKGRDKLFSVLKKIPKKDTVLLCFGEIDCRVHLLKQSELQNRNIKEIVKECVDRYLLVILEIKKMGYKTIVFNVIPSAPSFKSNNPQFPTYGSCVERNKVTTIFNEELKNKLKIKSIPFISIFDKLVDKKMMTKTKYLQDGVHLNQKAIPLIIEKINYTMNLNLRIHRYERNKIYCLKQLFIFKIITNKIKQSIKKIFPKKFIDYIKNKKSILTWYLDSKPVPPPHIIKQKTIRNYAKKYKIKAFIETGTYKGKMVEAVKKDFEKIYSIELDKTLYEKARIKFENEKHIKIIQGDSGEKLFEILKTIKEPCIFWLDGHYSGDITAKGNLNTPIFNELISIFNHPIKNHIILIDDARLFVGKNDYPTIEELKFFIRDNDKNLELKVKSDIINIAKKKKIEENN